MARRTNTAQTDGQKAAETYKKICTVLLENGCKKIPAKVSERTKGFDDAIDSLSKSEINFLDRANLLIRSLDQNEVTPYGVGVGPNYLLGIDLNGLHVLATGDDQRRVAKIKFFVDKIPPPGTSFTSREDSKRSSQSGKSKS